VETTKITERLGPGSETWVPHSAFHIARYQFAATRVAGGRVLDAGCGLGYGSAILKSAGAAAVQAIDIDRGSIEKARESFRLEGLEYLIDDCESLATVQGPFDVICNFENIEHLKKPEAFLAAACRLLGPDGLLFCSTPERATSNTIDGHPENPYHTIEWYRHEFRDLLGRFFDDVEMFVQVEALWALMRREARENLNRHLDYLWRSPAVRLGRLLDRLRGGGQPWPSIDYLAAASPADYPIVPEALVDVIGGAPARSSAAPSMIFNVAVCRRPR
jgi:SAM-dependent methyltransferase